MADRLSTSDVFVLPSIYECGGAVVLEAMAIGIPVIATAWGGPCDYLDPSCGILVEPSSEEGLIDGFARAMVRLARSQTTRAEMAANGRKRAEIHFCWDKKLDELMNIFSTLIDNPLPRMTPVQYDVPHGVPESSPVAHEQTVNHF